jgi:hypothetical protein
MAEARVLFAARLARSDRMQPPISHRVRRCIYTNVSRVACPSLTIRLNSRSGRRPLHGAVCGDHRYGTPAEASNQLRSRDGLAGALARPATHAHYEEVDLALQAAVLAHGIAETQPSSPSSTATSASRSSRCSPSWRSTAHPAPSDRSRARWLDHPPERRVDARGARRRDSQRRATGLAGPSSPFATGRTPTLGLQPRPESQTPANPPASTGTAPVARRQYSAVQCVSTPLTAPSSPR